VRERRGKHEAVGVPPWWHGIDMAQRRMIATLSDDELKALPEDI